MFASMFGYLRGASYYAIRCRIMHRLSETSGQTIERFSEINRTVFYHAPTKLPRVWNCVKLELPLRRSQRCPPFSQACLAHPEKKTPGSKNRDAGLPQVADANEKNFWRSRKANVSIRFFARSAAIADSISNGDTASGGTILVTLRTSSISSILMFAPSVAPRLLRDAPLCRCILLDGTRRINLSIRRRLVGHFKASIAEE